MCPLRQATTAPSLGRDSLADAAAALTSLLVLSFLLAAPPPPSPSFHLHRDAVYHHHSRAAARSAAPERSHLVPDAELLLPCLLFPSSPCSLLLFFSCLLTSPSISLALCYRGRHGRPRSSAPSLRPTPRRPCRRRRLGRPPCPLRELRADPAACRPPPPVRRRESPDPPVSDLPRHPSPVPDVSSAPESQASDTTRPCLLCPGGRHGGHRLSVSIRPPSDPCWCSPGTRHGGCRPSRLDPSAPGSTAEQPRSVACSATPWPAKASTEADKAHRKANGLAKQREDLRARVASRKLARARPHAGQGHLRRPPVRCALTPATTPGSFLQK
ncbi:translation initiation factor IF-2-like [Triticum dicoccoides]|uniref:translation initiation factor IF-2-like n=1 Tax=Triticum dicoccoides TaxID=85692 RepID=UPI00188FDBCE|nr:translation initiation factor IF-2-like [Triticum dicoccoides]